MPKLFALADLHLSLSGEKPMDVFGENWKDHPAHMAASWDSGVSQEDTVLLPGDLSWARKPADAAVDLAWLGDRPGRKLLLRGNHDSWWTSPTKVREVLPERCEILQNNSFQVGDWVVVGARGWTSPADPEATEQDHAIFRRELERLRLSVSDADRRFGRQDPRLAMLHFPPWIEGKKATAVVDVLRESGVRECVYGHLHGEDHKLGVVGERDGIRFHLVAADAVGFAPALILPETGEGS